jgi:hypothetical protein
VAPLHHYPGVLDPGDAEAEALVQALRGVVDEYAEPDRHSAAGGGTHDVANEGRTDASPLSLGPQGHLVQEVVIVSAEHAQVADGRAMLLDDLDWQLVELPVGEGALAGIVPASELIDVRLEGRSSGEEEVALIGPCGPHAHPADAVGIHEITHAPALRLPIASILTRRGRMAVRGRVAERV